MPQISPLASTILAEVVLSRVGESYGLTMGAVRVLALVAHFTATRGRSTYRILADTLGYSDTTHVLRLSNELAKQGRISIHRRGAIGSGPAVGLRLEPAGQAVVTALERAEVQARADLAALKVGRWKRSYKRTGKYAGRAQVLRERKQAKAEAAAV